MNTASITVMPFENDTLNDAAEVNPSTTLQKPSPTTITQATVRTFPNPVQAPCPMHDSLIKWRLISR